MEPSLFPRLAIACSPVSLHAFSLSATIVDLLPSGVVGDVHQVAADFAGPNLSGPGHNLRELHPQCCPHIDWAVVVLEVSVRIDAHEYCRVGDLEMQTEGPSQILLGERKRIARRPIFQPANVFSGIIEGRGVIERFRQSPPIWTDPDR